MDISARIVVQDSDHLVAVWNRTLIHIWRGAPTFESVGGMVKVCRELLLAAGGGVTCLAVVERSSPAPGEPARQALAQWSRELVPQMDAAVFVAEGSGFRSALVRGVGVALTTLMPHRVPFKFVSTIDEGLACLSPKIALSFGGVAVLRKAVDELRAKMG